MKHLALLLLAMVAAVAVGQIVVEPIAQPAPPIMVRVTIPTSIGDGLLAAARSQMNEGDRAELPSTNTHELATVNLAREGTHWTGLLTYQPR